MSHKEQSLKDAFLVAQRKGKFTVTYNMEKPEIFQVSKKEVITFSKNYYKLLKFVDGVANGVKPIQSDAEYLLRSIGE